MSSGGSVSVNGGVDEINEGLILLFSAAHFMIRVMSLTIIDGILTLGKEAFAIVKFVIGWESMLSIAYINRMASFATVRARFLT